MPAVYLIELLIHMGWYEKWQLSRVCHKEAQKTQKYLWPGLTDIQLKPILSTGRILMIYIQIPEEHDAIGFMELATSGIPVCCLPQNSYGVSNEHLRLLRRKHIPFKQLKSNTVRLPKISQPHDEKI
jgi:hypothetical protein